MIDWNDNAKAAVREFAYYIGGSGKVERYLEHVAPKKTVADAVEWNEKVFKSKEWQNSKCAYIVLYVDSFSYSSSKNSGELVCTRAEFEAYVKEQEGEKWTHRFNRERCYIKVSEEDCEGFIVIATETDGYLLCKPEELKPIKPKLTKAEAWDMIESVNGSPDYIKEQYDII